MRAGLMSRSEAISAFGYDAEDVDAEIAADNRRADGLGLVFDSDPRHGPADGGGSTQAKGNTSSGPNGNEDTGAHPGKPRPNTSD